MTKEEFVETFVEAGLWWERQNPSFVQFGEPTEDIARRAASELWDRREAYRKFKDGASPAAN